MNILLWIALFLGMCTCETFHVSGDKVFTLGLRLTEGRSTRLEMNVSGEKIDDGVLYLKNPSKGVIRTFKFENETEMAMSFIPEKTGDYNLVLENPSKRTILFTVILPETDEGPFASQVETNLGKDLEELLRRIISSHKSLLTRQIEHLEKAKNTKSWIKKLTLFEVGLCLMALYYVHTEAVKTFYSTRKM
ncbi:uncharacterized protein NEMAJ01_0133 [Nematocida major]|uniref:uncharacterized protein n=1 Tax=Nematocida major TaxID=1912982 RepID=UPI00200735AE|nr:uncharacterized protein NEMAJ01_0133 [Nematocida major]KAH9385237.1 hypothetical protein NEMAJ01_0133 [Nematocida major]